MPPCQPKGITLVELLVAIGIMTLTISLGALFLKNQLPKLRLYTAASDLAATMERARRLSVSEQIAHGIKFILADKAYVLLKFQPAPLTLATSTLPQSVSFYSTTTPFANDTARFNALGGAAAAGEIILQTDDGSTKTIKLNPSGYVQVE